MYLQTNIYIYIYIYISRYIDRDRDKDIDIRACIKGTVDWVYPDTVYLHVGVGGGRECGRNIPTVPTYRPYPVYTYRALGTG